MFEIADHFLGDTWIASTSERVHLYFLYCPKSIPRHTRWSVGHTSSTDLIHWTPHNALFHSKPEMPDWICLSTGSVAFYGNRYIMSFLGNHNQPDPHVILAESNDLVRWQALPSVHCRLSESGYSNRPSLPFKNPRWRDPFLFTKDGWLYQLMTAADASRSPDQDGVIAVMRTRNLSDWEFLPPLKTPPIGTDLECPKLYHINGQWHLLVSLFNVLQSPDFVRKQPANLNISTTFSLVADTLDDPFQFYGSGRILTVDTPGYPYACNAVYWQNQWNLLGTCWSDRLGDRINDPVPLKVTKEGLRSLAT